MPVSTKALKQVVAGGAAVALVFGLGLYVFEDSGSSSDDGAANSGQAVELVSHEGVAGETGPVKVRGVVRNTSDRKHGRVKVDVRFFNEAGSEVGDAATQTSGLGPGKEWRFEVPVVGDSVARYEIDRVTWQ